MEVYDNVEFQYSLYGRRVLSDIELPELSTPRAEDSGQFVIKRGEVNNDKSAGATEIGPFLRADTNFLYLQVAGIVAMSVCDGCELTYSPADGMDEDSVRVFLFGSGIAALLMQAGHLVLHGNAIKFENSCILCVAYSGVGKSTIAAGMVQRGYQIIADDVCPIDDDGCVIPGMPRIKLWQESADMLGFNARHLARVRPGFEKFSLPLTDAYCDQRLPVKAVIALSLHNEAEIEKSPAVGKEKFQVLRRNTFRPRFINGLKLQKEHFKQVIEFGANIPVYRIARPRSGNSLTDMLDMIEDIGREVTRDT